jgi:hypothetical protein
MRSQASGNDIVWKVIIFQLEMHKLKMRSVC